MEAMVLGEYVRTYIHTYVSGSCGGDKFSFVCIGVLKRNATEGVRMRED